MRRQPMNVFGDRRLLAVRHAVLPQIAFAELRRRNPEVAAGVDPRLAAWRWPSAQPLPAAARHDGRQDAPAGDARIADGRRATPHAGTFPQREREALPGLLGGRLFGAIEMQQPRLRPGVELELQRLVVLPGNPYASRLTHDAANAKRPALVAGGVVGSEVPRLG